MKKLTAVKRLLKSIEKGRARRARAVELFSKHGSFAEVGRELGVSRQRASIMVHQGIKEQREI